MTLDSRLPMDTSSRDTRTTHPPLTHALVLLLTLLPLSTFATQTPTATTASLSNSINSGCKPPLNTRLNAIISYTLHTMVQHTDRSAPTGHRCNNTAPRLVQQRKVRHLHPLGCLLRPRIRQ